MQATSKVSKDFWTSRTTYPKFASKIRRFHEINYLIPRLEGVTSLVDVGCGSGELLDLLLRLTDIESYIGLDISTNLLELVDKRVNTYLYDMESGQSLPDSDVTLFSGVIQYVFDDKLLEKLLNSVRSDKIIIRTSCTNESNDLLVSKYSQELGADYASNYRTLDNTLKLVAKHFTITETDRVYPDHLDSKFNSTQFWITATR